MRLREGPLRIWFEGGGLEGAELRAEARRRGLAPAAGPEGADITVTVPRTASREGAGRRTPESAVTVSRERASVPRPGVTVPSDSLSARELEILEALVEGASNAEIASSLGIGLRTVKFHLEGLYAKLGAGRRGEAVREALRRGLVRFES